MSRRPSPALHRGARLGLLAAALAAASSPGGAAARSAPTSVSAVLPPSGQAGAAVRVRGRAAGAPRGAVAELESQAAPARWTVLARASIHAGAYSLRWVPRASSFLTVRVVVLAGHRLLAATRPQSLVIGAAPVSCAPPTGQASLPPGDGRIVGGVYDEGGPAPGIYVCQGQAHTVTVTNSAGAAVATAAVAGGQSYSFAVPAGAYTLTAGFCRGAAIVTAGHTTNADTVCPVP